MSSHSGRPPIVQFLWHRHPVLVWTILCCSILSCCPSISFARQPTAMISASHGMVLVNNQEQKGDTILHEGDTLETSEEASVILQLSDGSIVEVGEKTALVLSVLQQTAAGARISQVKLSKGGMRTQLSQGHQQKGSSFEIETPNAQIGMTFSQPDVEVSYDVANAETIALAHTVALSAKNLLTDEEKMVPIGSMAIITAAGIKIAAGAAAASAISAGTTSAGTGATTSSSTTTTAALGGMGLGTKILIGAGVLAAAGGATALAISESAKEEECSHILTALLTNGENVHVPAGTRCDLDLSFGTWTQEEANSMLSEMLYEAIVDNISLAPLTPLEVYQPDGAWHIRQIFRTGVLEKGDHRARTIYRRNQLIFSTKEFTIRAE